jgi:type IV pilus assembly protein PilC
MAGEQSGKLEPILQDLATQLEKDASFASKIKTAAVYPLFILVILVVVAFLMLVKVIPQLEDVFTESGAQLPFVTRALLTTSQFCAHYWWLVILLMIVFAVVVALLMTTETFRYYFDKFKMHGPGIGSITTGIYMQRFTSTLSMLTSSGIPIIEAINIVGEVMNNDIYREELKEVASQVERGVPMSVPLSKNPDFPLIVSQMIMVGEQTGKIDKVLENLSKYYEEETDNLIKGATSLFEPVTIVIIGGGVAFLVFAILMPIYNLAGGIQ